MFQTKGDYNPSGGDGAKLGEFGRRLSMRKKAKHLYLIKRGDTGGAFGGGTTKRKGGEAVKRKSKGNVGKRGGGGTPPTELEMLLEGPHEAA